MMVETEGQSIPNTQTWPSLILYIMTTSVSRRSNILCIMFKIIAFLKITCSPGYMGRLAFYSHVESICIKASLWYFFLFFFSRRGEVCAHKTLTSLTSKRAIEVTVPSQESERSCIFVLGVYIGLFLRFWSLILVLFWQCLSVVFLFFIPIPLSI